MIPDDAICTECGEPYLDENGLPHADVSSGHVFALCEECGGEGCDSCQPSDACAECQREHGPHYSGPCEHDERPAHVRTHRFNPRHVYVHDSGRVHCGAHVGTEATYTPQQWSDLGPVAGVAAIKYGVSCETPTCEGRRS